MDFERVDLGETVTLFRGDCLEVMAGFPDNSIDTIITDPPYGLGFMGKDWDHGVPGVAFWSEALRVAKPGAMLLAFGGTRTFHRLACAIEDARWEIRDVIMWVYGSGFPKSHDIGKAIDREAGAEREVIGEATRVDGRVPANEQSQDLRTTIYETGIQDSSQRYITAPATPAGAQWDGWGTALKTAWEPIIVAMKPLDGTFANNALTWGVAGLWIDGGRVGAEERTYRSTGVVGAGRERACNLVDRGDGKTPDGRNLASAIARQQRYRENAQNVTVQGRWPANVIHDGSDEVVGLFPVTSNNGDSGSAARFFYCAKASRSERNAGLDDLDEETVDDGRKTPIDNVYQRGKTLRRNTHPTVKPLALMRYLCRLTKTPSGGVVLDPFMGSGTTGMAAVMEGRGFVGIELDADYLEIARLRIAWAQAQQEPPMYEVIIGNEPVEAQQLELTFD